MNPYRILKGIGLPFLTDNQPVSPTIHFFITSHDGKGLSDDIGPVLERIRTTF